MAIAKRGNSARLKPPLKRLCPMFVHVYTYRGILSACIKMCACVCVCVCVCVNTNGTRLVYRRMRDIRRRAHLREAAIASGCKIRGGGEGVVISIDR